jgi:hypothetical protein
MRNWRGSAGLYQCHLLVFRKAFLQRTNDMPMALFPEILLGSLEMPSLSWTHPLYFSLSSLNRREVRNSWKPKDRPLG